MFFFFDPKTLSDDELLVKQQELRDKIVWANRFGSMALLSNLQKILTMIEDERQERFTLSAIRLHQSQFPDIIDTDVSRREADNKMPERTRPGETANRPAIVKTKRPTSDNLKDV